MNIHATLAWMMFIGLFPLSFFWLRKAWKVGVRNDVSSIRPGVNAGISALISLAGGAVLGCVIVLIVFRGLAYESWTAAAGITIWMKFFADFILSWHARMGKKRTGLY